MNSCKLLFVTWVISVIAVTLIASSMPVAEAHGVSIVGDFTGKFDHKTLNAEGEFLIRNDKHTFTITGDLEKFKRDSLMGLYTNYNCNNISGPLVLESSETQINIEFTGKKCQYGYASYVIGTFESTGSSGQYEGIEGEGRITMYADHHANNVFGQLAGVFEIGK